ncbi:MAG: dihydropteroate synthase, partial [Actinomycetota bacterium]|nr:dihydropteroate synthase [Actinomycetota bacterium]
GAGIIDVGGESTRPGAEPVPVEEELRRVVPVIEALARDADVPISIDTRKPAVAEAAIDAGATIVNETSGEELDPAMDKVIASTGAGIIVMHSRGTPATMRELTDYDDVVADVAAFLQQRAGELESIGVPHDAIAIDPGFGFAKDAGQSLTMLRRFEEFVALGYPVLAGTSRKSFIGAVLDTEESDRLEGTAVTAALAVAKGARIVRVHDVKEMSRVVTMAAAVLSPEVA